MNHRRLLRFAVLMWAAPLAAASMALLGFLFLRAPFFVAAGLVLLGVGGACLIAGVLAVVAILATRNSFLESPRRFYKKQSLAVLGLLLLNLPLAGVYAVLGGLVVEPSAIEAATSPSGRYLAELSYLDERQDPPYGHAVTLRPKPTLFRAPARTVVFSGRCVNDPTLTWQGEEHLTIACTDAQHVTRRLDRYRDVVIRYRLAAAPAPPPRRRSK